MGLPYKEGIMGPMYVYQWRYFNKPYLQTSHNTDYKGIDQIKKIIQL